MFETEGTSIYLVPPRVGAVESDSDARPKVQHRDSSPTESTCATSEQHLLQQARAGNAEAFGELTERNRHACLKRAMLMIHNRSDAEDEVQNAFWKAFQRLEQFRGDGSFAAWLSRIVENQCLMRIREARNSRFVYLDESSESNVGIELVGQSVDPEDQLGGNEVTKLVKKRDLAYSPAVAECDGPS